MKYNYEIDQILITGVGGVGVTVANLAWHEGSVPVAWSLPALHPSYCGIARVERVHCLYRTD